MIFYQEPHATLYCGDSLTVLKELPSESVDMCVTSPPYYGLREYGMKGQIGLEPTPEKYVSKLVDIFHELRRVLKKEGTCWLNLGDSYASGGSGQNFLESASRNVKVGTTAILGGYGHIKTARNPHDIGLKPKDLIGIPWRVAFALQADGWWLRQDIIWSKPNPMPESVKDRCTKSHEYIFLLSKSAKYYYNQEAILEPIADSTIGRGPVDFGGAKGREYKEGIDASDPNYRAGSEQWGRTYDYQKSSRKLIGTNYGDDGSGLRGHSGNLDSDGNPIGNPLGRNKRSVWEIPTTPYKKAHFATYPPDLVKPCILAGCPLNGTVIDIFSGSGTTMAVAKQLGRKSIGIELNPDYCKLSVERLQEIPIPMSLGV